LTINWARVVWALLLLEVRQAILWLDMPVANHLSSFLSLALGTGFGAIAPFPPLCDLASIRALEVVLFCFRFRRLCVILFCFFFVALGIIMQVFHCVAMSVWIRGVSRTKCQWPFSVDEAGSFVCDTVTIAT